MARITPQLQIGSFAAYLTIDSSDKLTLYDQGRSLTASIEGIEKAKKALRSNSLNQTALARELGLSRSTVTNFFRQIPIERLNFEEICTKLALDWQDIIDITANETEIEEIENPIFKDPNFLGREEDIANINNLVNEGKKVILIKAEGGIGKTTLAENWFKIQGSDYLKLNVSTTSQTIKSLEEWLISQLKETFKITPAQNFGNMLDQLTTQLQKQKIGILIDNLEPALKNGKFIEPHQNYVDLLEILANQNIQGITIITSREQIYEHKIFRLSTFYNYDLEGLNEKTWQEYFENKQIIIDNDSLNAIWRNYGGNTEAMSLLAADILKESKGDLKAYWQDNSEDLLRHRSLEQLVKSQFDKLKNDNLQAYNLLCRVGVYPNQDINLPEIWLSCLLWDVPKNRQKRVINDLLSSCLIKKRDECYYLHTIIRIQAIYEFNLLVQNHNINILILKSKIDDIILNHQNIQSFLNSINQKLFFVSECYKKSAFIAVHLAYLLRFNENINNQDNNKYYELASRIDKSFKILFKGLEFVVNSFFEEIENYYASRLR
ncbi:AAA family ATPase, partial [Dolichospermum flos-aquae LEGE 04289]